MERLLHIKVTFGRSLHEKHSALLFAEALELLEGDLSFFLLQVELIRNYQKGESVWRVHHGLGKEGVFPSQDVLERFLVGEVIDEETTISTSIEGCTEGLVSFLPCRIPDLQRD